MNDNIVNAPDDMTMLAAALQDRHSKLTLRRDELLAAGQRVPQTIEDDETSGRLSDFLRKQVDACIKKAKDAHGVEKEPFLSRGRTVDAFFKRNLVDPLEEMKTLLLGRQTIYLRKKAVEEQRVRDEAAREARAEAERAAAEADRLAAAVRGPKTEQRAVEAEREARQAEADAIDAQRHAEAKAADKSRVRGDHSVTSLATFWDHKPFSKEDLGADALLILLPYIDQQEIEKAVRGYIRAGGRKLPGIEIFENTKAR